MDQITPKEVKILETAEDIQERREQVLTRYSDFKSEARAKREKLEDSRRFQVCLIFMTNVTYFRLNFLKTYLGPKG
jgi:hypothetical protein